MFGGSVNKTNLKNHLIPYLYHAGDNTYFLSGSGYDAYKTSPILVSDQSGWSDISTSKYRLEQTTLAIKNGELWAWGHNDFGQLGDGTTINKISPVRIGTDTNWEKISVGFQHVLAIRGGQLYAWGNNGSFQLGDGTVNSKSSPILIGTASDWIEISAGGFHSLGIRNMSTSTPSKGHLYAWGNNYYGQLGKSDRDSRSSPVRVGGFNSWIKVAAGQNHSLAIRAPGSGSYGYLYGWGKNDNYECGHTFSEQFVVWDPNTINQGSWWYWWWQSQYGPPNIYACASPVQVGSESDWINIDAAKQCSVGIRDINTDGTGDNLFYWGSALSTSNAQPTFFSSNTTTKVSIGSSPDTSFGDGNFAYIQESGTQGVYVVGYNDYGQLGNGTVYSSFVSTAYNTDNSSDYTKVSVGSFNVFAIKNGNLYGWGRNYKGLSLNDTSSIFNNNSLTKIEKSLNRFNYINVHGRTSFGIINGELWGWGNNESGQLGDGTTVNRSVPTRIGNDVGWKVAQSGGGSQTLAIKNGELYSWGNNGFGRGGRAGGDVSSPVRIGTENTWTAIGVGETVSFAIREGKLFYFGWGNLYGQGDAGIRSSPVQIGTLSDWTHVSGSWKHALAIRDGKLYSWGTNGEGQLGTNNTTSRSSPVQIGTESGWTIAWAGTSSSIGIRDGKLFTWGGNSKGQLGDGTTINKSSPVQVGTNSDWTWVYINGGGNQTYDSRSCVGIRNGELYAWGENTTVDGVGGLLGDGTSTNRSSPVRIGTLSNWIMANTCFDGTLAIR